MKSSKYKSKTFSIKVGDKLLCKEDYDHNHNYVKGEYYIVTDMLYFSELSKLKDIKHDMILVRVKYNDSVLGGYWFNIGELEIGHIFRKVFYKPSELRRMKLNKLNCG